MGEWRLFSIEQIKADSPNALATGPFGSAISSKFFTEKGVPVIRGGNLSAEISNRLAEDGLVFISEDKAKEFKRSEVRKGDLIFTCWGTINQVGFIDGKGTYLFYIISNKQMKLTPHPDKADSLFLYYYFSSPQVQEQIIGNNIGSSVPGFNLGQLKTMELNLPPLPEQKAIASVLSSLDDKIDLLHRQNKTLEALAETLFRQWFVEQAQEDWEEVKLGDFFDISSGKGLKRDRFNDAGVIPVLGANGEIGRTSDYLFEEKLIFTGRVGTLGNIFIVNGDKVWLSDNTLVFRKIRWFYFVYFTLKSSHLEDFNVGSTQPLVRQSDIKEIPVNIPSNDELDFFEDSVSHLFEKMEANKNQIRTLEKLRDTLLPKLMSGEVRVAV